MKNNVKKIKNILLGALAVCAIFMIGFSIGVDNKASATVEGTEQNLMEKDAIINQIMEYEDGLNKFQATTKAVQLSNLNIEKLDKLLKHNYKIIIIGNCDDNKPVIVEGNKILTSIHTNSGDFIDAINSVLNNL